MRRAYGFLVGWVLIALPTWAGEVLSFKGGACTDSGKGVFTLDVGGQTMSVEACWIDPKWGQPVMRDALKASVKDGELHFAFAVEPGKEQLLNKEHPMMVKLSGQAAAYRQQRLRIGPIEATFEKSFWAWGNELAFVPHQMVVKLSSGMSHNFLVGKNGDWSIRMYFPAKKDAPQGRRIFEGKIAFVPQKVKISPPVNIVEQKRVQYGRVLMPPQEKGFDTTRYHAVIAATNTTRADFVQMERLFDARCRLYAAAERLSYKPTKDREGETWVATGYAALSAMDLGGVTNACNAIEARLGGSAAWMPYGTFNPFNWVKCFTQWGYKRAADGCSVAEPNPWLLQWEDDFRCNLAQDARVAIAHGKGDDRFYTTRYLKPMTDVSFERTWVSTTWNLADRRITFSLLSPIVDIDGVDTLTLSGFSSEPLGLRWINDHAQETSVKLVSYAEAPAEVVPSILMDFTAPPPPPKKWSRGRQTIGVEHMIGPYFTVYGRDWQLAFFPTVRPTSVDWQKGVLTITFDGRGRVGMMRLMDNLTRCEQAEVCEFFARTYLAYPIACRSTIADGVARWQYAYRHAKNPWGTEPSVIAPVPPLVDYADIAVPLSRRFRYPTKWGLFRYCEGREVTCALPKELPREPRLRGVNVGSDDKDTLWEAHITNGTHWVRACFGGKHTLEEHCALMEDKLRKFGRRVKFLIDPHCREYSIPWKSGADPDPAALGKFYALWDALSKLGAKYPHAIEGYDIYNEPGLTVGGEGRWRAINEKIAAIIHRNHPGSKIYYSAVYGGNPNGLFNLEPLNAASEPQVITYHFYSPHAFSHQKCATHNRGGDTCVYYPAWSAPIDWAAGHHFGGTTVDWYDRWTLAAILLPAYEHYAAHRKPQHVGEFGIIGYANGGSPRSAFLWTRDAIELMEANGASWHLWNGGFGLGNRFVREYVYDLWKEK